MEYRYERDSIGEVMVPKDCLWGAQTQRSLKNFDIGTERMPTELISALACIKKACAFVNRTLVPEKMTAEKVGEISRVCDEIIDGKLDAHFPLKIWQTGSGTQTNMNVNEVIANLANDRVGKKLLHPNDDINMSQSSNDVFPTAMHIAAVLSIERNLIPAAEGLIRAFERLERRCRGIIKIGRTHLQDAIPVSFAQEISGWKAAVSSPLGMIRDSLVPLRGLALGGTAVGTGLNAPKNFASTAVNIINSFTNNTFYCTGNTFHALGEKDELVNTHGAMKALAANLMKIANDIRLLASGPRCGLGEITIPANEPGSSIMPGKVNPTQCEAVTMVAVQVMANDVAVGMAASQGNLELNVFMPVIIYNFLQSARLLGDCMRSFSAHCVEGIEPNVAKMRSYVDGSLMLVTSLNTYIGYEKAAKVANTAFAENIGLKAACEKLGFLTGEEFDRIVRPENMV
jgi:fumarate hydratase class II